MEITEVSPPTQSQKQQLATIEANTARAMAEVQGGMVLAKQFPRNQTAALDQILQACERKTLADQATYEYPRGDTLISGPSVRLAECIAQHWGNMTFGVTDRRPANERITTRVS